MFIIDPITLKKINIKTINGLYILKEYVKFFQSGGGSTSESIPKPEYTVLPTPPDKSASTDDADSSDITDEVKKSIKTLPENMNIRKEEALITGTIKYMPPEILLNYEDKYKNGFGKTNSLKSDLWPMGILFFKLLMTFDFYIILQEIQKKQKLNPKYTHNKEQIKKIIEKAKKIKQLKQLHQHSIPLFVTKDTLKISMKYIKVIIETEKEILSPENFVIFSKIFELIKNMIKYTIEQRVDINYVVNRLKNIIPKDTNDITIPFDKSVYNGILEKAKTHSTNTDLEKQSEKLRWYGPNKIGIYKIGNENEQDEIFMKDDTNKRTHCNNTNYCVIIKKEDNTNYNELLIHSYLSKKDIDHRYIVDIYTHKMEEDTNELYIYMEYVSESLKNYIDSNFEILELEKYYKKSNRKTQKTTKIAPEVNIYEKYKEATGVELGEACRVHKKCKLEGQPLGKVKCGLYGTKRKCKTSNKELAKKVIEVKLQRYNRQFEEKCIIMLKAAEALQFIHNNNILHGDIKPENVVIQKKKVDGENKYLVKFIDVGSSRVFMNEKIYRFVTKIEKIEDSDSSDNNSSMYGT